MTVLQESKGLSDDQLGQELKPEYLPSLAALFDDASIYVDKLGLSASEKTDVANEKTVQIAMQRALRLWHTKNPFHATYRNLLSIILGNNKGKTAVDVCDFLKNLGDKN